MSKPKFLEGSNVEESFSLLFIRELFHWTLVRIQLVSLRFIFFTYKTQNFGKPTRNYH